MSVATSDSPWRVLAETALRAKHWQDAIDVIRPQLEKVPTDAQAWVFLGEALEHIDDYGSAWACYDRGWILDPPAAWAPRVFERLRGHEDDPITPWVSQLLEVPHVRVMGAILVKNEASQIQRCIDALKPAVDEVVVVDTGSTDDTVAIARGAGATVIEVEWQNDFGAARRAADQVLGDTGWVLWVDADEFLNVEDVHVPRIVAGLYDKWDPPMLLRFVQVNHLGERIEPNYDTTRMYPLGRGLSWLGRIHEQIGFLNGPQPMQRGVARIRVDHWGYERDVMVERDKYARNIRLLREWTKDEPNNAAAWGFLGRDLFISGKVEEAVDALYRAEANAMNDKTYGRIVEVRAVLCEALVRLKRLDEARVVAERAVASDPQHPSGWYWQAQVALLQADERINRAVESARQAQAVAPTYRGLVSFSPEIPMFLAPVVEADALKMQGRLHEAWQKYSGAARVKPDHAGVQQQLNRLRIEAERILQEPFKLPPQGIKPVK
ncbi:glycosyltransferase [Sulfobacillus sp. hq2]|uniref:glycosyltransferase n=1 Tax=Sulfobacillus TaxID=28033 RepID=UPI000CD215D5|nr:glycosyltransferase [Sulfobacillus sp. hq2]POB11854.1 glycosyl transferase family 2 [Sulfobacillus sp. hq2]